MHFYTRLPSCRAQKRLASSRAGRVQHDDCFEAMVARNAACIDETVVQMPKRIFVRLGIISIVVCHEKQCTGQHGCGV